MEENEDVIIKMAVSFKDRGVLHLTTAAEERKFESDIATGMLMQSIGKAIRDSMGPRETPGVEIQWFTP